MLLVTCFHYNPSEQNINIEGVVYSHQSIAKLVFIFYTWCCYNAHTINSIIMQPGTSDLVLCDKFNGALWSLLEGTESELQIIVLGHTDCPAMQLALDASTGVRVFPPPPWVRRVLGPVIQDADENPCSTVADLARRNVIRQVSGIRESPYLRPPPQSTGRTITIIGYLQEENNPNLTEVVKVVLEYPAGA